MLRDEAEDEDPTEADDEKRGDNQEAPEETADDEAVREASYYVGIDATGTDVDINAAGGDITKNSHNRIVINFYDGYTLEDADKLRLKRRSDRIESEIQELEKDILRRNPPTPTKAEPDMGNRLEVFLCHASEDKPEAMALYDWLQATGASPWLDKKKAAARPGF